MHESHRLRCLLPIIALALACGQAGSGEGVAVLRSDLALLEDEVGRHEAACAAAMTLDDISAELGQYDGQVEDILTQMDADIAGWSHCSGRGMAHMRDAMQGMHQQMADHHARLTEEATLGAAQARCAEHGRAMLRMIDEAEGSVDDMGCGMM